MAIQRFPASSHSRAPSPHSNAPWTALLTSSIHSSPSRRLISSALLPPPSLFVHLARSALVALRMQTAKTDWSWASRSSRQPASLLLLKLSNLSTLLLSAKKRGGLSNHLRDGGVQLPLPTSNGSTRVQFLETVAIILCHSAIEFMLSAVFCYRLLVAFLSIFGDLFCTAPGWYMVLSASRQFLQKSASSYCDPQTCLVYVKYLELTPISPWWFGTSKRFWS